MLKRVDFQLKPTGKVAAADAGLPVAILDDAAAAGSRDWLAGAQTATTQAGAIDWLFPLADHNPRAPIVRTVIRHMPGQRVALTINGKQVEPLAFDGTDTRDGTDIAISRWTGIPLIDGDNRLQARVLAADGSVVKTLDRVVHYSGPGVRAVFDAASSRLVADGLTRPLIAVRVTDKTGRPVRAGTLVPFKVDQPYTAAVGIVFAVAVIGDRRQPRTLDAPLGVEGELAVRDDAVALRPGQAGLALAEHVVA